MFKEKQIYCIMLEDYYYPRTASVAKAYYGTFEDVLGLTHFLAEDDGTRRRYQELIEKVEFYDCIHGGSHVVAGVEYPLLTPMVEVCRYESVLMDHNWNGIGFSGAYCSFTADRVVVTQVLLKTNIGYRRCLKASFTNLRTCIPNWGWTCLNGATKGFPGVVTHVDNSTCMNLFIDQQYYSFGELAQAVADMMDPERINLVAVMGDIVGEM
ncbi:MAG: hypothetical protein IJV82_02975 [Oscillospiraceae bacterium]|nr:hypothetical protein [Oscillospiraceae bacterium]